MRQQHRPKQAFIKAPFFPALITESLDRKDPKPRNPEATAAIKEEVEALRSEKAWLENEVYELHVAKAKCPKANCSKIFAILGIKNIELDESEWVYKGRVVFGGDQVRDSKGQWAIFDEGGSVPTSMAACRALLAG